ncbi:hypothetical protein C5167_044806 [Papaver somniferum]|uniref:uncharacterized protein LOC113335678 n=1 Tax=Papaver somniferum TaxID=3469 RepID=UPI000E6FD56B|nr:uncharacterized protein LOC113335678 [Papaver somniferum]RZC90177.1 hypothetical protein C5167_044806 [Papaver somniferum]
MARRILIVCVLIMMSLSQIAFSEDMRVVVGNSGDLAQLDSQLGTHFSENGELIQVDGTHEVKAAGGNVEVTPSWVLKANENEVHMVRGTNVQGAGLATHDTQDFRVHLPGGN